MNVDELARQAGLVVSTVRLYQNKGLLPPPARRGRVGYYGPDHLARLRLVSQLQERGFSLAGIKELLDGMDRGETLGAVLGVGDGPDTWTPEHPEPIALADLAAQLPSVDLDLSLLQRTIDLGLIEFSDDAAVVILRQPSTLQIGRELAELGLPAPTILDEYALLESETTIIARRFTEVFRTHLWDPFVEEGMPADRVDLLIRALEKLGPLAEAVAVASLRHSLQRMAEEFVSVEAARLGVEIPRPGQVSPR